MDSGKEHEESYIMRELKRIADVAASASQTAAAAMGEINTHERECALRYGEVKKELKDISTIIPTLFTKMDKIGTIVYTGVGIMLAVPALIGIVVGLKQLFVGG